MEEQREDAALKDSIWYRKVSGEIEQALKRSSSGAGSSADCGAGSAAAGDLLRPVLVAIDGPCTSGKTTLARLLAGEFDCNVFHMDDFFLRPEQRTPERLAQIGGNVDYERFQEEVLKPVLEGRPVCYRRYDCGQKTLADQVLAPVRRLNLIEGSYSLHPYFGNCYDLAYCLAIDPEEQKMRILRRNGESMLERFVSEWIPKENAYLDTFKIRETADVLAPAE